MDLRLLQRRHYSENEWKIRDPECGYDVLRRW